jgi:hypothetical protein
MSVCALLRKGGGTDVSYGAKSLMRLYRHARESMS